MEAAMTRAGELSDAHTERIGGRAIDLLHVASALALECELFLTADERQGKVASAEGLKMAPSI
jgi:hypothetical protein